MFKTFLYWLRLLHRCLNYQWSIHREIICTGIMSLFQADPFQTRSIQIPFFQKHSFLTGSQLIPCCINTRIGLMSLISSSTPSLAGSLPIPSIAHKRPRWSEIISDIIIMAVFDPNWQIVRKTGQSFYVDGQGDLCLSCCSLALFKTTSMTCKFFSKLILWPFLFNFVLLWPGRIQVHSRLNWLRTILLISCSHLETALEQG